jgi:hypothetical protein
VNVAGCILAAAIAASGVGCGGSSGRGTSSSKTTSRAATAASKAVAASYVASTAASQPTQNVAADRAIGQGALLRLSDFPTGWTAEPNESNPKGAAALASCLGVAPSLLFGKPTRVDSPKFKHSGGDTVENSVAVEPTTAIAKEWIAAYKQERAASCLETAITTKLKESAAEVTYGKATVAPMSFPSYGEELVAYRITVPAKGEGTSIDIYLDGVLMRVGRGHTSLDFTSSLTPSESVQEEHLTSVTAGRLQQALAAAPGH